ncbi:MAG: hypothetical protein CBE24_02195 [bacterium TMED264]|nr:MAG: hypothetical protein CBE24_02195 [bacterium TMED264]|tara:strand:- start:156 stop:1577 length:1422 start_codon:yes stop_codon:yes gene_type:complete
MSIKLLGKQSLVYGFGHVTTRLVTFLLLPLYTNQFTPEQYGIVALFYTFVPLLNIVVRYGMGASFLKNYVPANKKDRLSIMTNVIMSLFLTGILFLILFYLFRADLSLVFFGVVKSSYVVMMGMIIFFDTIYSIPMLALRAENKPRLFISLSFLNVGITLFCNLVFIIIFEMNIGSIFLSNLIASSSIFLLVLPYIYNRFKVSSLSIIKWKSILSFALPFLPAGLFAMVMEVADRYILKLLTDLETVGIYNAGYKIGVLMLLTVNGFNMGWQPYFLEKNFDYRSKIYPRINSIVLAILGFIWISLLFWADDLIKTSFFGITFFGKDFFGSLDIIPWIGLSYFFYGFYHLQTPGVFLKNRPKYAAYTRLFGAFSNVGLCFLLIPMYGAMGAAFATCISFGLMALSMFCINRYLISVKLESTSLFIIFSLLIISYLAFSIYEDSFLVNLIIMFSYVVAIFYFKIIRMQSLNKIFS